MARVVDKPMTPEEFQDALLQTGHDEAQRRRTDYKFPFPTYPIDRNYNEYADWKLDAADSRLNPNQQASEFYNPNLPVNKNQRVREGYQILRDMYPPGVWGHLMRKPKGD